MLVWLSEVCDLAGMRHEGSLGTEGWVGRKQKPVLREHPPVGWTVDWGELTEHRRLAVGKIR